MTFIIPLLLSVILLKRRHFYLQASWTTLSQNLLDSQTEVLGFVWVHSHQLSLIPQRLPMRLILRAPFCCLNQLPLKHRPTLSVLLLARHQPNQLRFQLPSYFQRDIRFRVMPDVLLLHQTRLNLLLQEIFWSDLCFQFLNEQNFELLQRCPDCWELRFGV